VLEAAMKAVQMPQLRRNFQHYIIIKSLVMNN
jgi:hypothetical protein